MYGRIIIEDKEFILNKLDDIKKYAERLKEEVDRKNIEIPDCIENADDYINKISYSLSVISRLSKIIMFNLENDSYTSDFIKNLTNRLSDLNEFTFELASNYIVDNRIRKGLYSIIKDINEIMSYIINNINDKCECSI